MAASFMGRAEARQTRVGTRFSSSPGRIDADFGPLFALLRCLRCSTRHRLIPSCCAVFQLVLVTAEERLSFDEFWTKCVMAKELHKAIALEIQPCGVAFGIKMVRMLVCRGQADQTVVLREHLKGLSPKPIVASYWHRKEKVITLPLLYHFVCARQKQTSWVASPKETFQLRQLQLQSQTHWPYWRPN
ncbi:hypothetical protein LI328DRAFT_163197 [Trichoderma asperelloides]|nr:hypothetical protein LI328DRAFT_163197 [Trichoderma asperelloides]